MSKVCNIPLNLHRRMESSESMLNDKEALSISLSLLQDYFTTDSAIKDFLASKGVTCLTLQPEFSDPLHGRRDSAISTLSPSDLDADDEDLNCSFQCVKR